MAEEDPEHVHVTCYDDDPITKAILAGESTADEAFELRLRAAGWPDDDLPAT